MGTHRGHRNLMKTGVGVLLLLALIQTGTEAQNCPGLTAVDIDENNAVDALVTIIAAPDSFALEYLSPQFPFRLEGKNLLATESLDYETKTNYAVEIGCTPPGAQPTRFNIIVSVKNLNDNGPKFDKALYPEVVEELTPIGEVLGPFFASDPDNLGPLIYTLTTPTDAFRLRSPNEPEILVNKLLQFDDFTESIQLTLTVQDTDPATPDHTDTTTIDITITDKDNRPPWFQPCTEVVVQGVKICPDTGYKGTVDLGEFNTDPLPLTPNNLWAKDGDKGINEPIKYSIISGDEGLFEIDQDTGNITLVMPINVTQTIHMTVMAFQAVSTYQFASTSLTMDVVIKSDHTPQFEKLQYEAMVEGVGSMAVEAADKNKALKIVATDQDYEAAGGINPNIVYSITGHTAFSIINGFVFMTTDVPAGSYNLQVKAVDTKNPEEVTAQLTVEVVAEPTTTAPPTTVSTPTPEPTTAETTVPTPTSAAITTNQSPTPTTAPTTPTKPDPTSPSAALSTIETANPSSNPTSPGPSVQTTNPTPTAEVITTHTGVPIPPGGFTSTDMAALGATLGVLLFICIVVITVLAVKIRKGDSAWKKINEASAFRSSLGPSGKKEGVQFTNEAFQHDDDKDNKGGPSGGGVGNGTIPSALEAEKPQTRSIPRPPSPIQEEEKEVKPILSKDKSKEDGYKAVWFKEDIDPNAKEEVVIIPDSREEEEEEDSDGEMKIPKVKFNETDGDSGLGEKMDDSEEERAMTSSL